VYGEKKSVEKRDSLHDPIDFSREILSSLTSG
jgi:hypothetical protein